MTDNTVHLIKNNSWYNKRRPKLQIDVLSCLTLRGKLSKGQAEKILNKRHGDILKSFDRLEEKKLIKKNKSRIFGRGRRQYIYEITKNGIETLLLDEATSPLNFWKIIYGYCHNTNEEIEITKINEFFQLYFQRYLPYYNTSILSHLDIFNKMFQRWFNDFINNNINGISSEQKVLEIIAIYPNLTFKELAEKTTLGPRIIKKVLDSHSMKNFPNIIKLRNEIYIHQNIVGKLYNKKYWDFFQHMLIKKEVQDGICRYELTLFGIILILKLLRYYNINNKENQYFNKLPFLDYIEKIVRFNRKNLPLIFGKWSFLKQIMNVYAVYNFDVIFEENINFDEKLSLSRGGNKELHYSIREIFLQTRMYLGEFANAGQTSFLNYFAGSIPNIKYNHKDMTPIDYLSLNYPTVDIPNIDKTKNIKTKLEEILILLHPVEQLLEQSELSNVDYVNKLLEIYENEFANEISAFYFFNLYYEFDFDDIISKGIQKMKDNQSFLIPKECLSKILKLDEDISIFYFNWKNDISILQNKIFYNLKYL